MIGFLALNKMHSACKYPGPAMLFKEDEAQFALHNFYYEWLQRMEALVTFSCKLHSWKSILSLRVTVTVDVHLLISKQSHSHYFSA